MLLLQRILLLAACLFAGACRAPVADAGRANVVFLHWNDFHGQFRPARAAPLAGGAGSLATFVRRERAAADGRRVVVTDGGDWFQGTLEGNETRGQLSIGFFARLGIDATVIGNHEYDFGDGVVKALCAAAPFPVLGANVVVADAAPRRLVDYVQPFAVVDVEGLKVALVGVTDQHTKEVSTGPWGEAGFEDPVVALRATLPAARAAADVVVLLSHCGLEVDRRLAEAFPEIPLILGGHSHTGLPEPVVVGDTWIAQTYGKASGVYRIEARADAATGTLTLLRGGLVELDHASFPPDAETERWIAAETMAIAARWDEPIGTLETDLTDDRGARSTAAGNLVCDAFLEATGAQLAFHNKGGLRTQLRAGPLTRRMLYELLPFDNGLVSMDLTGAQLRALLETSLADRRRLLEIGGGRYHYAVADGERRLGAVTVAGAPLQDDQVYRVATNSFLARGGDGLAGFTAGTNRREHGVLLRDVLIGKAERDSRLVADETNRILFDR